MAEHSYTIKNREPPLYEMLHFCLRMLRWLFCLPVCVKCYCISYALLTHGQGNHCLLSVNLIKMSPNHILLGQLNMRVLWKYLSFKILKYVPYSAGQKNFKSYFCLLIPPHPSLILSKQVIFIILIKTASYSLMWRLSFWSFKFNYRSHFVHIHK